jgi:hypothetical protein
MSNWLEIELNLKKVNDFIVPYRDSSLTKLLMNALGGNSRTIMVNFLQKLYV